jgi:uncharacterized protein YecE (DUF72 family)
MPALKLYTGCSGFYNRHWRGIFYPEKVPQRLWFTYYSQHLNSLEINSTFYQFPKVERLQKWYDDSPADFVFSVKAPRLITHFKSFTDCEKLLDDFYATVESGLREKLGCVLFQLPARVEFSEERLAQFCLAMRPGFRNVIEFRHASWWRDEVFDTLQRNDIIFCNVSFPGLPEIMIATEPVLYMRLHGDEKLFYSNYDRERLQRWHEQLYNMPGIRAAFVYFNNTAGIHGIQNALEFRAFPVGAGRGNKNLRK